GGPHMRQSALIHDGYERTWHATPGMCGTQTKGVMEAFLVSAGVVALAEIGDKTQFLALLLAARFRAPVPVTCGILSATLVNHFAAGALGTLLAASISPAVMRYLLAASFLATALWMLIPDRPLAAGARPGRFGAYGSSLVSFCLLNIGDKTQIATVALGPPYHARVAGSREGAAEGRLVHAPAIRHQHVEGTAGGAGGRLVDQRNRRPGLDLVSGALANGGVNVAEIEHPGLRHGEFLVQRRKERADDRKVPRQACQPANHVVTGR